MNQHTSDASNEGKYTFTLVFVVFIVMTGGFVFLATLYAEVIASWVSGTEAIGGAEYTKFDELWEPLSKWYSSVVGVFVGFAGAIVALWLAVQVHKLSEKQHKLTEKQHQTDLKLLKVEQFKFAKDRSNKNAKVVRSRHTAAKLSVPILKLYNLNIEVRDIAFSRRGILTSLRHSTVPPGYEGYDDAEYQKLRLECEKLEKKIRQHGEEGFPAVKELLDILEEKLLFSDNETCKRVLEKNFGDFPSQIKPSLEDYVILFDQIDFDNFIDDPRRMLAKSAIENIDLQKNNPEKKGLYPEAVISSLRFLIAHLKAAKPNNDDYALSVECRIPKSEIGNLWGHLFIDKMTRPSDVITPDDFSGEFLPVAEFGTDICSSDEWDFVPSMINALFDFPTPFQDAEEEVEKIMGGIQEDIMNSEEKQNLQELLRENLHHDIFQLNTKDDNGFFTWLKASSSDEWQNRQASLPSIHPTVTRSDDNPYDYDFEVEPDDQEIWQESQQESFRPFWARKE